MVGISNTLPAKFRDAGNQIVIRVDDQDWTQVSTTIKPFSIFVKTQVDQALSTDVTVEQKNKAIQSLKKHNIVFKVNDKVRVAYSLVGEASVCFSWVTI